MGRTKTIKNAISKKDELEFIFEGLKKLDTAGKMYIAGAVAALASASAGGSDKCAPPKLSS